MTPDAPGLSAAPGPTSHVHRQFLSAVFPGSGLPTSAGRPLLSRVRRVFYLILLHLVALSSCFCLRLWPHRLCFSSFVSDIAKASWAEPSWHSGGVLPGLRDPEVIQIKSNWPFRIGSMYRNVCGLEQLESGQGGRRLTEDMPASEACSAATEFVELLRCLFLSL